MVQIRRQEIPIATTMVGGYPRPHWLQGRVFTWGDGPQYISMAQRVAYEDALRLCMQDQERAGLDLFADGLQYEDYEAHGYQQDVLFHMQSEMLEGYTNWGAPHPMPEWSAYYVAKVVSKVKWARPIFQGVVDGCKRATDRPFKITFIGPVHMSIQHDQGGTAADRKALAMDLAEALNTELKYLRDTFDLEAAMMIDVTPAFIDVEGWHADANARCWDGLDGLWKFQHACYGRTEGQYSVHHDYTTDLLNQFSESNGDVLLHEFASRNFANLEAFKNFPEDRVLCAGVINDHELQVEKVEDVVQAIRRLLEYVPADRLMVAPDCGLRWLPRHVAAMKLKVMVEAAKIVRAEL